jgi:hypothetical protein
MRWDSYGRCVWCRGGPEALYKERRKKLARARHPRKLETLKARHRTLPLESGRTVA